MKKKTKSIHTTHTHAQCRHAVLVQAHNNDPVLAQCTLRPTDQHPHSPYEVEVASSPACPMFELCANQQRKIQHVDWAKQA